ncbi:FXSXX-COOH protein [Actinorugispora endophytica]|uniref:FXSXX-COOH protein n=1 Tax=Actinorugispora endophytica TaxID=1605990 RepID=A0A4R6VA88_9ACTN|nr:FXSXX-COOH protein [Actinorugispora endophytica]
MRVTMPKVSDPDAELRSELVDLGGVELSELAILGDSAFSHALRRVREEADNPPHSVAGFEAVI